MERDAVVIEAGINEAVPKALHPLVPHSPGECAADARRCADAGAAVVHWHAIDESGAQRLGDVALHAAALEAMDGHVLAYPSYPIDVPDTVDERLGHCFALRERHGLELGPIDVGSANLEALVVVNSHSFVLDALRRYRESGLVPSVGSFDIGFTRTVSKLVEDGHLAQPVFCKIFLWGAIATGPEPSVEALDLHLRQFPRGLDVEWVVVPRAINDRELIERLSRAAIERGGGVRIGLGDNPRANLGVSNPELVERVTRWAAEAGRPVASSNDLRMRLGLPAR